MKHFRVALRALLHDIARDDLTYLRMYVNAKMKNFGFEFQDGSTLAKESSKFSKLSNIFWKSGKFSEHLKCLERTKDFQNPDQIVYKRRRAL